MAATSASNVRTCCVVVGKVGAGKSTFLNNVARPPEKRGVESDFSDPFPAGVAISTSKFGVYSMRLPGPEGQTIDLVDIPGTDGQFESNQVAGEYLSALDLTSSTVAKYSQIAKIFLVGNVGKPDLTDSFRFLLTVFGPTALPHIHMVFTHVDFVAQQKYDQNNIEANHGLVHRLIGQTFSWIHEHMSRMGVPFKVPTWSCVGGSFSGQHFVDMYAEIDHIHAILRKACRPESPRYSVLELTRSRCYISDRSFEQLAQRFQALEARRRGLSAGVHAAEDEWSWTENWMAEKPDSLNSVFDLYNTLVFCDSSWKWVEDNLKRSDKLQFSSKDRDEELHRMIKTSQTIMHNLFKNEDIRVSLSADNLFVFNDVRACPECGLVYLTSGCASMTCERQTPGHSSLRRQVGRVQAAGDIGCGVTRQLAESRPVYLHELLFELNFLETKDEPSDLPIILPVQVIPPEEECRDSDHRFCHPPAIGCHFNMSNLDHPRISLKHTVFSLESLQEMSIEDFRYHVYGSQNMVSLMEGMFSKDVPCPPHLVDEVLRFLEAFGSDNLALAEKILSPTNAKLLCYIIQKLPRKFSIGSKPRMTAILNRVREEDPDVYINLVGSILTTDWFRYDKEDTIHAFLKLLLKNHENFLQEVLREHLFSCPCLHIGRIPLKVASLLETPHEVELFVRNLSPRVELKERGDQAARLIHLIVERINAMMQEQFSAQDSRILSRTLADYPIFSWSEISVIPELQHPQMRWALCRNLNVPISRLWRHVSQDFEAIRALAARSDIDMDEHSPFFLSYRHADIGQIDAVAMALLESIKPDSEIPEKQQINIAKFAVRTQIEYRWGRSSLSAAYLCRKAKTLCDAAIELLSRADPRTVGALLQRREMFGTPVYLSCYQSQRKAIEEHTMEGLLRSTQSPEQQDALFQLLTRTKTTFSAQDLELFLLECLATNPYLSQETLRNLLRLNFERIWRIRRELGARSDLTEQHISVLLEPPSFFVYRALSANNRAPLSLDQMSQLAHFASIELPPAALEIAVGMPIPADPEEAGQLLNSFQAQCRMLLAEHHKDLVTEELVYHWCDTPDIGVFSSLLHFFPRFSRRIAEPLLGERIDRIAAGQLDLIVEFVERILKGELGDAIIPNVCTSTDLLQIVFENPQASAATLYFLEHHPVVTHPEYSAPAQRVAASSSAATSAATSAAPSQPSRFQLSFASAIRLWELILTRFSHNNHVMDALVKQLIVRLEWVQIHEDFDRLLQRFCADPLVEYQHIDRLSRQAYTSSQMLMTILQREDITQEALWSAFLSAVKRDGYHSPVLITLSKRPSLPEEMRWVLALLQSKLGLCSIYQAQQQVSDFKRNRLFKSFLLTDFVLPEPIVNYYLLFEEEAALKLIRSTFLSAAQICHIVNCRLTPAVRDYLERFFEALVALTGIQFNLLNFPFASLPSSAIFRKIIEAHTIGITLRDLRRFFSESLALLVPLEEATKLHVLSEAVCAMLPVLAVEEHANDQQDENDDDDENENENEPDIENGEAAAQDEQKAPESPALFLKIHSLSELQLRLAEMIETFDFKVYLPIFLTKGFFLYQDTRTHQSEKQQWIVAAPQHVSSLFQPGAAGPILATLNTKIYKWLATIFTADALSQRRPEILPPAFSQLLSMSSFTIEQLFNFTTSIGFTKPKYLEQLISRGFANDIVQDLYLMQKTLENLVRRILQIPSESRNEILWNQIDRTLINPLRTRGVESLPYSIVYHAFEFFPRTLSDILPKQVLDLISVWQRPEPSDDATVATRKSEISELLRLFDLEGIDLIRGVRSLNVIEFQNNMLCYVHRYASTQAPPTSSSSSSSSSQQRGPTTLHTCTLVKLRSKLWEEVLKLATKVRELLGQLKSRDWTHRGKAVRVLRIDTDFQSEAELERLNCLTREFLGDILTWNDRLGVLSRDGAFPQVMSDDFTLGNFVELVEPFANIVRISIFAYMHRHRVRQATNVQSLFNLSAIASKQPDWASRPLKQCLVLFEILDLFDSSVATQALKSNSLATLETALAAQDSSGLNLPAVTSFRLLRSPLTSDPIALPLLFVLLDSVMQKTRDMVSKLEARCCVTILSRPHPTQLRLAVRIENVQIETLRMDMFPYILDQDSVPQVDPQLPSEWLRDRSRPKQLMPVEFPKRVEYQTPEIILCNEDCPDLSQLPIQILELVNAEFNVRVDKMIADEKILALSSIGTNFLDNLVSRVRQLIETGITVTNSDRTKLLVKPLQSKYESEVVEILNLKAGLGQKRPADVLSAFKFSRRPTIANELRALVQLIAPFLTPTNALELGWTFEEVQMKYFELCFAVSAIQQSGTFCAIFKVSERDVLFLVSDSEQNGGWNWRLQHNPNACATIEFTKILEDSKNKPSPVRYLSGEITLLDVLFTPFGEVLLMVWSASAIERIRRETDAHLRQVVASDGWTSETGHGLRAAGKINWFGNLNHFSKEVARLNASTEVYLQLKDGFLIPDPQPQYLLSQLDLVQRS